MHRLWFSTLDSDRHTWLPRRRRQGCKPADPDTTGEPQTAQRRKVRYYTTCMNSALTIVACPHTQTLRPTELHVFLSLYTRLSWRASRSANLAHRSFIGVAQVFFVLFLLQNIWIVWWGFLFLFWVKTVPRRKSRQLIKALSSVKTTLACWQQVKQLFICCSLLYFNIWFISHR